MPLFKGKTIFSALENANPLCSKKLRNFFTMKHKHVEKIDLKMRPLVLSQFHQSASTQISLSGLVEDEGREGEGRRGREKGRKGRKSGWCFGRMFVGAKEKKIKKVKNFLFISSFKHSYTTFKIIFYLCLDVRHINNIFLRLFI